MSSRNSLLTVFFYILLSLAAFFFIDLAAYIVVAVQGAHVILESQWFWFLHAAAPTGSTVSIVGAALSAFTGAAAFIAFRNFFRNTGQGELFFLSLFSFSLSAETLRLGTLVSELLRLPPFIGLIFSRLVVGGRVFGLLALLFGSLYALDFSYQKFEIIVTVSAFFSFLLAAGLSFESQIPLSNGLFRLSDERGLFILCMGLFIIIVVNHLIAGARRGTPTVSAGIVLLTASREAVFFALTPFALAVGGVILIGGFVLAYTGYKRHYGFG